MGDQAAADLLADLQRAMEPEAWAELIADYTEPEPDLRILRPEALECPRCGCLVAEWVAHAAWHYQQTITIRAAIWHALKAPMAVVELTRALGEQPTAAAYPVPEGSLVVLSGADFDSKSGLEEFARQLKDRIGHDRFLVLDMPRGEGAAVVIGPDDLKDRLREAMG